MPAVVLISGRNARRAILCALQASTDQLVTSVRQRCRTDVALAAVVTLRAVRPAGPKLLIWDNAPHHPHRVRDAAQAVGITLPFLPLCLPELIPLEELWRGLKQTVAANRCYPTREELTDCAVDWLTAMSAEDRLRRCSVRSSIFAWLST